MGSYELTVRVRVEADSEAGARQAWIDEDVDTVEVVEVVERPGPGVEALATICHAGRAVSNLVDELGDDCPLSVEDLDALGFVWDIARRVAEVYNAHELWDASGTSGADDAAAFYAVCTAHGMPVA